MTHFLARFLIMLSLTLLAACAGKPPVASAPLLHQAQVRTDAPLAPAQAAVQPPVPVKVEPQAPHVEVEDSIRSTADGIDLAFHRRVLMPIPPSARNKVVLLLPPVSIPNALAFDVRGYSLMQYLAEHGYDVWAVDYRGFGRSSAAPVAVNGQGKAKPATLSENAIADVKEAIDTIIAGTRARDLTLIGYGYGGLIAGMTAQRYPDKVSHLVLYGTAFSFKVGKLGEQIGKHLVEKRPGVIDAKLPAYLAMDWQQSTLKEWLAMMNGQSLADPEGISAAAAAFYATDYVSGADIDAKVRCPTGPMLDMYRVYSNRPAFDAAKITMPTLIVRGDMDPLAEPDLAGKLKGTKIVREIVVKNATHFMLYEKAHDQVFAATSEFIGSF